MKFGVYDQGIFPEVSNALSQKGKHEVTYFTNWQKSQPQHSDYAPGENFDYLKKEKYFFPFVEKMDCLVNFDCFDQDMFEFLKKVYPNKSIFGSGKGEILEADRWKLKKLLQSLGLPMHKAYHIIGISRLRKFLKDSPDKFVKTNIFRQDCESFYAKNYKFVEQRLNALEVKFGSLSDTIEFIAEEPIKTDVEIGFDGFFNGNDYIDKCFIAYEYHKQFYLGMQVDYNKIPKCLKETMDRLKPTLQKMDYRGALSTEEKIKSQKEHYFLDICSRLQSPASAGYGEWIKNWPEVVYKIGKKEKVSINCPYKYVGALFLETDQAKDECVYIDVKPENRDKIKLISACKHGDDYYAIKGCKTVAVVVAQGNDWKKVIEDLKKNCDLVDADGLNKDVSDQLKKIEEVIKNGEALGINFS